MKLWVEKCCRFTFEKVDDRSGADRALARRERRLAGGDLLFRLRTPSGASRASAGSTAASPSFPPVPPFPPLPFDLRLPSPQSYRQRRDVSLQEFPQRSVCGCVHAYVPLACQPSTQAAVCMRLHE